MNPGHRYVVFLLILLSSIALGQRKAPAEKFEETLIGGTVIDSETKQGIGNVSILIHGTFRGVATDDAGYFELKNLAEDVYLLEIRHVAYRPRIYPLRVNRGDQRMIVIEMRPRTIQLPEVLVEGQMELPGMFQEVNAYKIIGASDIVKSGSHTMREVLQHQAPFAGINYSSSPLSPLSRPPMLYINGILTETWVLDMIDVTTIEKILVWRTADAPIGYRTSTSRYVIDIRTKAK
jgi:hypothetical protein